MKKKLKKVRAWFPKVVLERVIFNSEDKTISAVDMYDESTGIAYFFRDPSAHRKGI